MIEYIVGGVTAPKGFRAAGIHCGIRKNKDKKDLALIFADVDCAAAAVYTTNRVQAAPIQVTKRHLENGRARAIVANSGNANACAPLGLENAISACKAVSLACGIDASDIIINSTGVIGQTLPVQAIVDAAPALVAALSVTGSDDAAGAIMTTDTIQKQTAISLMIDNQLVKIGAIAKGSGMIHPNMATMLCFITTDMNISSPLLQEALSEVTRKTFNRISVDGDTSTNDMTAVLASCLAGNTAVVTKNDAYYIFENALFQVCSLLAKLIATDGEGATRLVCCTVTGAASENQAETLAMSVTSSSLVKAAMFGADANWGRVLCAMGYAGVDFDPTTVNVTFQSCVGDITVCENGRGLAFDEARAKQILTQSEVTIRCELSEGSAEVTTYGCDLTYDYVKINGDYRT